MANKSFFSRFRLVYRPSSPLLKSMVLVMVILSTVALLTLGAIIRDTNANTEDLRQQAANLLPENEKYQDKVDNLGTVESVKDIATEEGGLVDPGTVFFTPENNTP